MCRFLLCPIENAVKEGYGHDAMRCKEQKKRIYVSKKPFYFKSILTQQSSATKLEDAACALRYDAGSAKNVRLVPGTVMRKSACFFLSPSRLQSAVSIEYAHIIARTCGFRV